MKNNRKVLKILNSDIKRYKSILNNRKKHNIKVSVQSHLIKLLSIADYISPVLLSLIIAFFLQSSKGDNPFIRDKELKKASVQTIDTSDGNHSEKYSYNQIYNDRYLEYISSWDKNENDLYERKIIKYQIKDNIDIDLNDYEKIFSLSKEEILELFQITDIETIKKSYLESDDDIYKEDTYIIVNNKKDYEKGIKEDIMSNFADIIIYIILTTVLSVGLAKNKKILIKKPLYESLGKYKPKYKIISEEEIAAIEALFEIQKSNLDLLTNNQEEPQKKLIRRKEDQI